MINLKLYNKLMVPGSAPRLRSSEWLTFLELCDLHLNTHGIRNPVVVELGLFKGNQKKFYEQLLGAKHIGININSKHTTPDIIGDTHDPGTLATLKGRLGERAINILFIDASHTYDSVKQDYEMYAPLVSDIVAFHDLETGRYKNKRNDGAWKFWEELRTTRYAELKNVLFISIHERHLDERKTRALGIGMIIKR